MLYITSSPDFFIQIYFESCLKNISNPYIIWMKLLFQQLLMLALGFYNLLETFTVLSLLILSMNAWNHCRIKSEEINIDLSGDRSMVSRP